MGGFVAAHSAEVDRLRRRAALGVFGQDRVEMGYCGIELVRVEVDLPHSQQQRRDELLGREEAYRAVVFLAVVVKDDDGGCPRNLEFGRQRTVGLDLDRHHSVHYEIGNFFIGVRNCTHLFAADSARVEEIEQDRLFFRLPPAQGLVHL